MANKTKKKKSQSALAIFWRRFKRNKGALVCLIILAVIFIACYAAPLIAPYDYDAINARAICKSLSFAHLFGTDDLGRDIFSRCLYGGIYSLTIGVVATIISSVLGMLLGAVSGFFGGKVDMLMMRACDVIQAIPNMLLSIVIAAVLGNGFWNLIIALALGGLAHNIRMVRAATLTVCKVDYVEAATALNCSKLRIILTHIIPNTLTPVIVGFTMGVPQHILAAAGLAYIGLGIQPPNPEWGAMLSAAKSYLTKAPHMLIFPGLMIAITVLCFNLLGDGIRDALDPKLKN